MDASIKVVDSFVHDVSTFSDKLANRGSVEERALNVAECAVHKRRALRQLLGTITIPEGSHTAFLGKQVRTDRGH